MGQSIVVADDDDTIRRLIEHKLTAAGYDVTTFVNGQAAWEYLDSEDLPDLCVLDVMMPGMTGLQVLDKLRASHQREVPVIVLTSRGREEDVLEGIEAGATDYMTKPFSPRELLSRVELRIGSA